MPFNGVGQFVSAGAPYYPAVPNTYILASYYNTVIDDLLTGLSSVVTRSGQSSATGNWPMAGFTLTSIRAGAATGEPLSYLQAGAQLAGLRVTTSLTVDTAATVTIAAAVSPTGAWDYRGASSLLVTTQPRGTNNQTPATTAYVQTELQNLPAGTLPSLTGNAGKLLTNNGTTVSWGSAPGSDLFLFQNFGGF